ncbi:hypothetical protein OHC33_010573 [Knufia fluminis]|uniref:DUF6590 domain-containing protein n=1 Tax=Knufia fluminis TaxID=191047 RepID=A0AAN8E823_9EURO|nr:hypothetical protein OHC33_010573 [Knufia fluminis]
MSDLAKRLEACSKRVGVDEPFELDRQWYQKLSEKRFKPITLDQARSLQNGPQTPRTSQIAALPPNTHKLEPAFGAQLSNTQFTHRRDAGSVATTTEAQNLPLRPYSKLSYQDDDGQQANALSLSEGLFATKLPRHELPAKQSTTTAARSSSVLIPEANKRATPTIRAAPRSSASNLSRSHEERHKAVPTPKRAADDDSDSKFAVLEDEFTERAMFLADNAELLKTDLGVLLEEAVSQVLDHDVSAARQCMQSLVILQLCQKVRPERLEAQVQAMDARDTDLGKKFLELYTNLAKHVQELAKKQSGKPRRRQTVSGTQADSSRSVRQPSDDTQRLRQQARPGYSAEASRVDERTPQDEALDEPDSWLDNISQRVAKTSAMRISIDNFEGERMKRLSPHYKVPENGARFFVQGRVFALLWHESEGQRPQRKGDETDELTAPEDADNLGKNRVKGSYGVIIFSHIRRMVVIKNRKGYCWCLPVGSYGGLGLKKKGLKREEIDAHAIIHDSRIDANPLTGEPTTTKRPIAVDLAPGQELSKASRLHFAKPCSVEWNTRVMDVSKVRADCIPALVGNAHYELFGDLPLSQS